MACAGVTLVTGVKAEGPEPVATPPFIIPCTALASAPAKEGEPAPLAASQVSTVMVTAFAGTDAKRTAAIAAVFNSSVGYRCTKASSSSGKPNTPSKAELCY